MAFDAHSNFAISAVATAPSPAGSGTTLGVSSGDGSKFPAVPFNATVWASGQTPTLSNAEIVRVTARSGDSFTAITRAQEGTSARTVVIGDQIMAAITAKVLTDIETQLAPLASPALTGTPTAPTQAPSDNSPRLATTAYVTAGISTAITGLAPLASPAFTGTPTAPTVASSADSTTKIATTAFVHAVAGAGVTLAAVAAAQPFYVDLPENHGAKRDGKRILDAAMASGSTTLTSASAAFTSADAGKIMVVTGAGSGGGKLVTTISSFTNATTVVLAAANASGGAVSSAAAVYGTDDTAACAAAVANAVTQGIANGSYFGEVWFSAGIYMLSGAVSGHGSPNFASSQIPLPMIASGTSAQKFELVLKGLGSGGAVSLPHWNQTTGQISGATLYTTLVGTNDVTYGEASVIGGATEAQGYGGGSGNAWSNMLVVVDGLRIVSATVNPTMTGFNFEGLLEAKIVSASYMADASPAAMTAAMPYTNQWATGLKMPATNNNDLCVVQDWSAEGVWYSITLTEHCDVKSMRSVYCGWGIMLDNRTSTPHTAHVWMASIEICTNMIGLLGTGGNFRIDMDVVDGEGGGFIWDGNSLVYGRIGITANVTPAYSTASNTPRSAYIGNWSSTPLNGRFINLRALDIIAGAFTTNPTVPATGVDFWNGFGRDCAVSIGGTGLTVVAIDGQTQQVVPGVYIVPEGKKINLTYTGTVTWAWIAL